MNDRAGIDWSRAAVPLGSQPGDGKVYFANSSSRPSDPSPAKSVTSCPRARSRETRIQTTASSPPAKGWRMGYLVVPTMAIRSGWLL